jgi:GPH family glycoside/pentoside/hexuronide:cation symporter
MAFSFGISRPVRAARTRTKAQEDMRAEKRVDLAYSMAIWPFHIGTTPSFFIAAYLNHITGASLAVLGLTSTAARIFDAIFNPFVGALSDKTRSRFGRRKPWVLVGVTCMLITLAVGIFILPTKPTAFSALWFFGGLVLLFASWTTAQVPFNAHAGEFTTDYDRRSRINLSQSVVGIVASLVTYLVPYILVDPDLHWLREGFANLLPHVDLFQGFRDWLLAKGQTGVANYGRVMVCLAWLVILTTPVLIWRYLRLVPEPAVAEPSARTKADKGAMLQPLRNKPFLIFCLGYLVFIAGFVGRLSLYPFIVPYALGGGYSFLLLMQIQGITGIIATPIWSRIFMKFERGQILMLASAIEAIGLVMLGLSTHGMPYLSLVGSFVCGLPGATVMMVPYLVASESADFSRLKNGGDTRGLHIGIIGLIGKIGNFLATMGLALAGLLGFNPSHGVSPHDVTVIKWLGLYGPAILITIGGAVMMTFPITRLRHRIIQNRLDQHDHRRNRLLALDPQPLPPLPGLPEPPGMLEVKA